MDIVVVGSCNTDLISYASHLPKEGETITGHRFSPGFGGKGANQCVTAVRLGANVAMVGKLGDDVFGKEYYQHMLDENVNCEHLKIVPDISTGVATIYVADNGANCIIIVHGANGLMTPSDVEAAEEVIKGAKVLICQNEIPQAITLTAMKIAKKYNVKTVYNPAPACETFDPELFQLADFFCPNETEAELIAGCPIKSVEDAKEACKSLRSDKGCNTIIITLGDNGAVLHDGKEATHITTTAVKAVDTTGAGDSFVGSLSYFLAKRPDLSVAEIVSRACQIASISVLSPGTQTSFPKAADLPPHVLA